MTDTGYKMSECAHGLSMAKSSYPRAAAVKEPSAREITCCFHVGFSPPGLFKTMDELPESQKLSFSSGKSFFVVCFVLTLSSFKCKEL